MHVQPSRRQADGASQWSQLAALTQLRPRAKLTGKPVKPRSNTLDEALLCSLTALWLHQLTASQDRPAPALLTFPVRPVRMPSGFDIGAMEAAAGGCWRHCERETRSRRHKPR